MRQCTSYPRYGMQKDVAGNELGYLVQMSQCVNSSTGAMLLKTGDTVSIGQLLQRGVARPAPGVLRRHAPQRDELHVHDLHARGEERAAGDHTRKKERKQTTQGRDGRTVHRHHTGILRR